MGIKSYKPMEIQYYEILDQNRKQSKILSIFH